MPTKPWTKTKMKLLHELLAKDASIPEMAAALGRSINSVNAKVGYVRHGDRMNAAKHNGIENRPTPRRNDDRKHLALIARANGGYSFPAFDLPAAYRRAA